MNTSFLIEENTNISNFLEGDDLYIPSGELIYLHIHPLIRPNFLTQIDDLVQKVGVKIIEKNVQGKVIEHLSSLAVEIGTNLEDPEGKAVQLMKSIRELYQLCIHLDKTL